MDASPSQGYATALCCRYLFIHLGGEIERRPQKVFRAPGLHNIYFRDRASGLSNTVTQSRLISKIKSGNNATKNVIDITSFITFSSSLGHLEVLSCLIVCLRRPLLHIVTSVTSENNLLEYENSVTFPNKRQKIEYVSVGTYLPLREVPKCIPEFPGFFLHNKKKSKG